MPEPWDSHQFVEQVARARGRRIHLSAVPAEVMDDKTCGLWVNADSEDYLLYSEDSPAWHADLVICHELSHMLFEHDLEVTTGQQPAPARQPTDVDGLAAFLPDLDPDAVRSVLGRSGFTARREFEAEYLATLILDRATSSGNDSRQTRMLSTFLGADTR
ncbi:hypothetical protein O4328_39480 [Rhodococcus opacus]|uniref:IrrE N-terminal-like domain-containing protein n=1 Tax=Rhodococcus opacus TaxID=37919 RepID=A0AAX3YST1_RHOOP|nr:hypothetical protein [Rhodococcus opacus]MCZ4589654.1 hypothetical protein [Rhodococcus opacus]WLF51187.1 hypothetical protein Q5707_38140 [Rhodococcus opacus]